MTKNLVKPRNASEELILKIKLTKELIEGRKSAEKLKQKNRELRRMARKTGVDLELVEESGKKNK